MDSIFDQLTEKDKDRIIYYCDWRVNVFIRGAIYDRKKYNLLLHIFGEEIISTYMTDSATKDGNIKEYNSGNIYPIQEGHYPLADSSSGRGIYYLYYQIQHLFDNSNRLFVLSHNRDYYLRKYKSYDIRKMQQVLELHSYPEAYSNLAD